MNLKYCINIEDIEAAIEMLKKRGKHYSDLTIIEADGKITLVSKEALNNKKRSKR